MGLSSLVASGGTSVSFAANIRFDDVNLLFFLQPIAVYNPEGENLRVAGTLSINRNPDPQASSYDERKLYLQNRATKIPKKREGTCINGPLT